MRKIYPKARFCLSAYHTDLHTEDKELASIVFDYLAKNVNEIEEGPLEKGAENYAFVDNTTDFATTEKALALEVYKHVASNQSDPLEETINRLEEELA